MRSGGSDHRGDAHHALPLRVRIARMDPSGELSPAEAAAWLDAAGPQFRLAADVTVGELGVYVAESREPGGMDQALAVGYMTTWMPARRSFIAIRSIWVEPAVRRRGIGRQLAAALANDVGGTTAAVVLVSVARANTQARQFFASVGFDPQPDPFDCGRIRFARTG